MTGLNVLQMKTKIVSCHTANSKPVKQEVNGTVKLPPLVFPACTLNMLSSYITSVLQIKTKIVSCHTANSKPVKHEVNDIVFRVRTINM